MATGDIKITPGTGNNIAVYDITEDSETKKLGRAVLSNSLGTEIGNSTTPVQVSLANTGSNATAVKVDGSAATQPVTVSSGTVSTVTSLTQFNGSAIALNTGVRSSGTLRVTVATDDVVPASQSGTWTVQPGNTPNTSPWLVTTVPKTSGGLSAYHLVSAASTNATVIKASAGQVFGWFIYNSNASARKVAFHNASSTPTAGASVFFSLVIPPASGANVNFQEGIAFSTGISITTVTGIADSDNTGVASTDLVVNVFYA